MNNLSSKKGGKIEEKREREIFPGYFQNIMRGVLRHPQFMANTPRKLHKERLTPTFFSFF